MNKVFRSAAVIIAALLFLPIGTLFVQSVVAESSYFQHIVDTVLTDYLINSVVIAAGSTALAICLGLPLAWWVARYQFLGRGFFHWALILPLAMPPYLSAYLYTDLLDYSGWVQSMLRQTFGWQSPLDYWFFDIRSIGGAIFMLGFALFPYVYLIMRTTFSQQSPHLRQAAETLGMNSRQIFWKVSLPLARPALVVAGSLVAMESLADFGTVNLFAVSTLTTAVYESWLEYGSLGTAAKLSCILLLTVFVVLGFERFSRRKQSHYEKISTTNEPVTCHPLMGLLIVLAALVVLSVGFLIPASMLVSAAIDYFDVSWNPSMLNYALNSAVLGVIVALVCLSVSLLICLVLRNKEGKTLQLAQRLASLGYAVPGTVMAIGVLVPLTFFDLHFDVLWRSWTQSSSGLLLSGSLFALVFAYTVRFFAIANGTIESGLGRISPSLDMAAATLRSSPIQIHKRVHFPLLTSSSLTALLLVFIECIKELPAALLLRPFGYETLATYVYQYASDEQLEHAAIGALFIVLVGLVPLWIINRNLMNKQHD